MRFYCLCCACFCSALVAECLSGVFCCCVVLLLIFCWCDVVVGVLVFFCCVWLFIVFVFALFGLCAVLLSVL